MDNWDTTVAADRPYTEGLSEAALRTTGVSPWVKALLAREFEGAKTLKQEE